MVSHQISDGFISHHLVADYTVNTGYTVAHNLQHGGLGHQPQRGGGAAPRVAKIALFRSKNAKSDHMKAPPKSETYLLLQSNPAPCASMVLNSLLFDLLCFLERGG